jgi:hypothetical protein
MSTAAPRTTANNGTYRRGCTRCGRANSNVVRVVERGENWVVAEIECRECGVDSRAIVGERGHRAIALIDDAQQRATRALDGVAS